MQNQFILNYVKKYNTYSQNQFIFPYSRNYNARKDQVIFTKSGKKISTKSFKIKQEQTIYIPYFFQDLTRSSNFVEILRKVRHQEQQEQQQSHS